jgi:hypothetical protein
MSDFLITGPQSPIATVLMAHGAGAAMDSPFMEAMAALLAAREIQVLRFEFAYMASRRATGKRKPAPKAELLADSFRDAAARARMQSAGRLFIGGKSMGGRVASLVADDLHAAGTAAGLICLGYPFHPPGMPEKLRTRHLETLVCPALIVQGERDPFGGRAEVEAYRLSPAIRLVWVADGDHDFGPRGGRGVTRKGNLAAAADAVAAFVSRA